MSRPSSTPAPRRFAARRALGRLAALGAVLALAACTERLESGIGCPELCPDQNVAVLDTIIEPIVDGFGTVADSGALDTTLVGFPGTGVEGSLLLSERVMNGVDTLVTYAVVRYDTLPKTYRNGDSTITTIDSVYVQVHVDTVSARRRVPGPVLLEVFDVDTVVANQADTTAATLVPLFRPDRRIGSRVVPPDSLRDSVKVPLSAAAVLAKLQVEGVARMRIGLRASAGGAPVQIRLGAATLGGRPALLNYDPSPDTAIHPIRVAPRSLEPAASELADIRDALADFTVVVDPMRAEPNSILQVGGLPGRRAFLRFHIPANIADSSTIIRATLLLTQRADPRAVVSDTVTVQPAVVLATGRVGVGRAANILDFGNSFGLDSLRLLSGEEGVRSIEMVNVVRAWVSVSRADLQHALVFRSLREAELPVQALFYSSEADPALRPRLRLSYVPSVQLGTR